jgi:hypothetical protein
VTSTPGMELAPTQAPRTGRGNTSRTLRPLAAFAILAMLVAGCSNAPTGTGSGDNTTATTSNAPAATGTGSSRGTATPNPPAATSTDSRSGNTTTATPGAPAKTDTGSSSGDTTAAHEQAVKFAECMRNNGVSKFPDPDASGKYTIDEIANGSSVDTSTAAWQKAIDACKNLQPPGFTGHKRSPQEQENALKFAQCIRVNGVPDFPDPTVDEPLVDTNRIPSAAGNGGMSILNAAMKKCSDIVADQLRGQ